LERSCPQSVLLFIRLHPTFSGNLPPRISGGRLSERSCRQLLFLFIRLLPAFSGDLPPGMPPGQPSKRSCRQLLFLFIRLLPAFSGDLPPGIQCVLVIRESFTKEYGSRVSHSSPCGPLFLNIEPNQMSLITRTLCIERTALGTILSTVVLSVHQMCHDHDPHVFSTTICQKKQGRLCQKKQGRLCQEK